MFGASFYCNPKCGRFYPPPPDYVPGTSRVKLHIKIFPMFVCIQLSRQLPAVARFAQSGARSPIVRRQVFCRNPGGRTCQVDRCVYLTSGRTWQMGGPACQVGRPDRICPVQTGRTNRPEAGVRCSEEAPGKPDSGKLLTGGRLDSGKFLTSGRPDKWRPDRGFT